MCAKELSSEVVADRLLAQDQSWSANVVSGARKLRRMMTGKTACKLDWVPLLADVLKTDAQLLVFGTPDDLRESVRDAQDSL
jgi:hypothetical protein